MNKKYYFIDTSEKPVIDAFKPRIPVNRMPKENDTIARICLSSTIEGCLTAAPWGWADEAREHPDHVVYRVYEFDADKIPEDHIYMTKKLVEECLVPDAEYTNEVWVVGQKLRPDNMYYIIIDDCETYVAEDTENKYVYYDVVENAQYRKVNDEDIVMVSEMSYKDDSTGFQGSWTDYILEYFTYTQYININLEKCQANTKLTFPVPHAFAREHLEHLAQMMQDDGSVLEYL